MAQLIKLYDYVSRYEWNIYRYPSQFIRLKKENWNHLYENWVNSNFLMDRDSTFEKDSSSHFNKIKNMFIRAEQSKDKKDEMEKSPISIQSIPSELQLRQYFLDQLYPFQIKWATSTLSEMSVIDERVETDETLKYFLQRFPDIYLIMYYPVFNIRKAPVDGEIIVISPTNIEIITLLEFDTDILIVAGDDRRWTIESDEVKQIISPMISLRRTEAIVKSILKKNKLRFPIRRSIISRTNPIVFHTAPFNTNIIGKNEYEKWFQRKRTLSSPLKREQLKVAESLINYCISTSIRRPEWEQEDDIYPVGE